jgi:hypothetical protein
MERSRLQDDLLHEFKEERELISEQLDMLDKVTLALHRPAAAKRWSAGILISMEVLSWLAASGAVAFCFFRDRLYPFHLLASMRQKGVPGFDQSTVNLVYWTLTASAVIIALLLVIVALSLSRIRRKNAVLKLVIPHIKTFVGQHLKRKAALNSIEQRHFGIWTPMDAELAADHVTGQ